MPQEPGLSSKRFIRFGMSTLKGQAVSSTLLCGALHPSYGVCAFFHISFNG